MKIPLVVAVLFVTCTVAYPDRYALIVGQNYGGETVGRLRYAESDAQRCQKILRRFASFPDEHTTLLLHPDSSGLAMALDDISRKISATTTPDESLFFLYYSGHADALGLLLDSSHYSFTSLKKGVSSITSGMKIAVLDACQSGSLMAFKGGKRAEQLFINHFQKTRGEVWIASSSANEQAQESDALKSSLFSFHFFNGLRGSADKSGDQRISLNEGYQYAYKKTIETSTLTSGIVQHPVFRFNITGEGDIILADLRRKTGGITIGKRCSGSFLVMSRDYINVYADFKKKTGHDIFIALAPGDYTIINAQSGLSVGLHRFSVSGASNVLCAPEQFHQSFINEVRKKGTGELSDNNMTADNVPQAQRGLGLGVVIGAVAAILFSALLVLSFKE